MTDGPKGRDAVVMRVHNIKITAACRWVATSAKDLKSLGAGGKRASGARSTERTQSPTHTPREALVIGRHPDCLARSGSQTPTTRMGKTKESEAKEQSACLWQNHIIVPLCTCGHVKDLLLTATRPRCRYIPWHRAVTPTNLRLSTARANSDVV